MKGKRAARKKSNRNTKLNFFLAVEKQGCNSQRIRETGFLTEFRLMDLKSGQLKSAEVQSFGNPTEISEKGPPFGVAGKTLPLGWKKKGSQYNQEIIGPEGTS
jgi:hypothetical protein